MTNAADAGTGEMTSRNLDEAAGGQCCGFYYRELVALFLSVVMPVSDAWSDMFVLVGWYYDGQHGWFTIGVLIHIIAGTLSGCLCAAWELSPRTEGAMAALWFPFGIIIGVAGMAPVVSAAVAISDGGEESNREQIERDFVFLKAIKAVELIFESLPQAAVQCYVGVSYGYLDPGAVNFSPLLTASVSIALFNAGATIMGTEAMGRNLVLPSNYHRISLMSSYGAITAAWRFTQVSTFILWLSLFTCNSKALGAIPATVGVLTLGAMVWEAGFERSEPETQSLKKARFLAHIHLANIAAMIFLFLYEGPLPGLPQPWEPAANNYMNQSAPETDELGALQHYRCQARTSVIVPAVVFAIISPVLMHISLNNDPQHGNTELKEVVVYLEKEVAEMRFLTRADFEFDREYSQYMRATLNRKGGIHQGVVVRLIHKVETYNSETQVSHILLEGTVGSYAPLGTSEFEKHGVLKGLSIPVDFSYVEIVSQYLEIHYEIQAQENYDNPNIDDEDGL